MAECLIGFASLAVAERLPADGARLLAAAVQIGGQRIATVWAATRREYEFTFAQVRTDLSDEEFQIEQAIGSSYDLEQAIEYVQSLPFKKLMTQKTRRGQGRLSKREREVASLIAEGKSNDEIAADLVVSKRTIEKHIAHIRAKLGYTQRAQIVRWAMDTGLANSHRSIRNQPEA